MKVYKSGLYSSESTGRDCVSRVDTPRSSKSLKILVPTSRRSETRRGVHTWTEDVIRVSPTVDRSEFEIPPIFSPRLEQFCV